MAEVVAGADFGSNKVGFIIAALRRGRLEIVERDSRFTRLAEGIAESGRIGGAALLRTLEWCREMREHFERRGVTRFRGVGTEALRRAKNQREILQLIHDVLGAPIEVISGEEEGRLTFEGVRTGYPRGPLAVIDIGGGSTEVAIGHGPPRRGRERVEVASRSIGAVVLTERCGEDWPKLGRAIHAALRNFTPSGEVPGLLTVLGGTGANVAMMDLGERDIDDARLEGHVIGLKRLRELRARSAAMTPKQRVRKLGLLPQRADIQIAGLAILESVLEHLGIEALRISRFALRHGVLKSAAAPR